MDFTEPLRTMFTPFLVLLNGSKPSKQGRQLPWTSVGPENRRRVTSIPKFCHYSKKVNLMLSGVQ
jgi:hypothetical protein